MLNLKTIDVFLYIHLQGGNNCTKCSGNKELLNHTHTVVRFILQGLNLRITDVFDKADSK